MTNFTFSQSWWRHFRPFEVFWQSDRFPLLARPSMREVVIHRHRYKYFTKTVQILKNICTNTSQIYLSSQSFIASHCCHRHWQDPCFLDIVHAYVVFQWYWLDPSISKVFVQHLSSISILYGKYFAFVLKSILMVLISGLLPSPLTSPVK